MNKIILFFAMVMICFNSCQKTKTPVEEVEYTDLEAINQVKKDLFCIKVNGKYGFIDIDGNLVIVANLSYASDYTDGVAKVCLGNDSKYTYIDCTGKQVFINKDNYKFYGNFENTVYDNEPELLLPKEKLPEGFIQELYLGKNMYYIVKDDDNIYSEGRIGAVLNENGEYIIPPMDCLFLRPFERDMALIQMGGRGFSGYLRYDGKVFWSDDYRQVENFEDYFTEQLLRKGEKFLLTYELDNNCLIIDAVHKKQKRHFGKVCVELGAYQISSDHKKFTYIKNLNSDSPELFIFNGITGENYFIMNVTGSVISDKNIDNILYCEQGKGNEFILLNLSTNEKVKYKWTLKNNEVFNDTAYEVSLLRSLDNKYDFYICLDVGGLKAAEGYIDIKRGKIITTYDETANGKLSYKRLQTFTLQEFGLE
ncbi:MAG: WG repeat-containing protein [Treponemataceae bacterium]